MCGPVLLRSSSSPESESCPAQAPPLSLFLFGLAVNPLALLLTITLLPLFFQLFKLFLNTHQCSAYKGLGKYKLDSFILIITIYPLCKTAIRLIDRSAAYQKEASLLPEGTENTEKLRRSTFPQPGPQPGQPVELLDMKTICIIANWLYCTV